MDGEDRQREADDPVVTVLRPRRRGVFGRVVAIFRRRRVPPGFFAYLPREGGPGRILGPGSVIDHRVKAILISKERRWVPVDLADLKSREGLAVRLRFGLEVEIPDRDPEARLFAREVGRECGRTDILDLSEHLSDALRPSLSAYVADRSVEEVVAITDPDGFLAEIHRCSGGVFLERGMVTHRLTGLRWDCQPYEDLRLRELDLRLEEERVRQGLRFLDLWKRQELGKKLAESEVKAMEAHLRDQGILQEIDREARIDRARLDLEVERTRRLNEVMEKAGLRAQIFHLKDENLKARLYRLLIESEMTPEQLKARSRSMDVVQEELEGLAGEVRRTLEGALKGGRVAGEARRPVAARARRVLLAGEKRILAYDPSRTGNRPQEFCRLSGAVGAVRSVRAARLDGRDLVLAGAHRGVYAVGLRGPEDVTEFAYPVETRGEGGANSVALHGGGIYASHSEHGVYRWAADGSSPGEALFESITRGGAATRGIQFAGDMGYFSSGPCVYAFDPARAEETLATYGGQDSVTSLAVAEDLVLAGTKGGRVIHWPTGQADRGEDLGIREVHPIPMVRIAWHSEERYVLVGTRDTVVHAVSMDSGARMAFRSERAVRWVDGDEEYVYGVDRSGRLLYLWRWDSAEEPARTVRLDDKARDFWMEMAGSHPQGTPELSARGTRQPPAEGTRDLAAGGTGQLPEEGARNPGTEGTGGDVASS